MKLVFLYVGDKVQGYLAEGVSEYLSRISHYAPVEEVFTKDAKSKGSRPEARAEAEARAVEAVLKPTDDVILLDEGGKSYTSEGFADFLQKRLNQGSKRLVFVVGGPYGFSGEMRRKYPVHLSLSAMTFSHHMVRLFLAEQVYRAFTILRNEPYHNR
ncbi:MAG TPA: 23S rRNA (pseudouridine(1915)-N(3))-methyltransferase RlmH [Cryomorphaceae bacterium]|nr:23S rRNA (pseudouridine(1915)-N(3))-methyltransferase RlmH [Cryomorphaceae bacterium]